MKADAVWKSPGKIQPPNPWMKSGASCGSYQCIIKIHTEETSLKSSPPGSVNRTRKMSPGVEGSSPGSYNGVPRIIPCESTNCLKSHSNAALRCELKQCVVFILEKHTTVNGNDPPAAVSTKTDSPHYGSIYSHVCLWNCTKHGCP